MVSIDSNSGNPNLPALPHPMALCRRAGQQGGQEPGKLGSFATDPR
jgi:hypothetical protein